MQQKPTQHLLSNYPPIKKKKKEKKHCPSCHTSGTVAHAAHCESLLRLTHSIPISQLRNGGETITIYVTHDSV